MREKQGAATTVSSGGTQDGMKGSASGEGNLQELNKGTREGRLVREGSKVDSDISGKLVDGKPD